MMSSLPLHRRTQSEVHFRMPEEEFDLDVDDVHLPPFQHPLPTIFSSSLTDPPYSGSDNGPPQPSNGDTTLIDGKPGHHRSNSADGTSTTSAALEGIEAKKAMSPDKLAELWTVDPKRAKRILANRQSAARSKERRAFYVLELERKIQSLQTEATTLSAQLNLFQRDTSGLTTENTELKLRLQSMEQQAKLCDALNEALKKEVDRLKIATGEIVTHADAFGLGMHQLSYSQAPFFSLQQQQGHGEIRTIQMPPQMHQHSSNMSPHQTLFDLAAPFDLSDMLPNDSIGQFQGLDISHRVSHVMMPDGHAIPVNNKINHGF